MQGAHRVVVVLCAALSTACMVGDGERVVSADEPLPGDLIAGDIVQRGLVEVVVPEPGEEVSIIADLDDGTSVELSLRHPRGGAVELIEQPVIDDPLVIAAGPSECSDGAYSLSGHKWTSQYQWSFHAATTPSANNTTNVETGLKVAAAAIVNSRNSCGLADEVGATQQYLGRTSTTTNIQNDNGTVRCTQFDRKNVVGFGSLPSGILGVACSWTSAGSGIDSDVRMSTRYSWFALDVPAGCSNKYGVQAVAVHEFGHAFGLGHVAESTHGNLTMSTHTGACSNAQLSLGLGDVRALRQLY